MYQQLPTAGNGYHAPRSCTSCQNMSKLTWKVSSKLSFGCPFRHALTKPWPFTAFHRPLRPLRPCDGFFALPEVGSCGWVPSAEAAAQCDAGDVWRPGNRGMAFVCLIKYVLRIRYAAKSKYWVLLMGFVDHLCGNREHCGTLSCHVLVFLVARSPAAINFHINKLFCWSSDWT